ncbi:TVP38/TMEM64 family protein [Geminicoccaceae bacterium 1502E]|nr:TVP38/TMEM64 family protein [Geminicoccaceae bacterium 1502E]
MPMATMQQTRSRTRLLRRLLPLLVLLALVALAFALGLHEWLSFETLRRHRQILLGFVSVHPLAAPLLFVLVYAAATGLSLPGGVILTLAGGFLFGTLMATGLVVVGATAGAVAVFLIARTSLGEALRARAGPWLKRMEAGFHDHAFSYLLVLRLVPLFPFWLVNLVPAFLGVRLATFALATLVGIIPGSFVYASVGAGLGAVFEMGGTPDLGLVFEPRVLLPLLGLALLALLPVAYRRWRGGRNDMP